MKRNVRRVIYIGAMMLLFGCLTGCEKMEHGPAENLPKEATEVWLTEVHAQVESAVRDVEGVKTDVEQVVGEAQHAVAEAERLMEELRQEASKEGWQDITPAGNEAALPIENIPQENVGVEQVPMQPEVTPQIYEFTHSEKEYFADALFIGDSRTKGLQLYGTLDNADYFAEPGLSLYTLSRTKLEVGEHNKIGLEELLEKEQYGKIYLMLGINELGYNFDTTLEKYQALVTEIRTKQPEAVLYVCANLHVTDVRDKNDEIHNNDNIDRINTEIEAIADEQDIFYLDVNPLFDDEAGNLNKEIASDDSHVRVDYYDEWCNWLGENTIVK